MTATFFDRQDERNPLNGLVITDKSQVSQVFHDLRMRDPFFCELIGQRGHKALVGIGQLKGCVQHSRIDGQPPYLMAVSPDSERGTHDMEFLIGNTKTPISSRYCVPFELVVEIAGYFLVSGEPSTAVAWEEI
jgi:hypothetical protein